MIRREIAKNVTDIWDISPTLSHSWYLRYFTLRVKSSISQKENKTTCIVVSLYLNATVYSDISSLKLSNRFKLIPLQASLQFFFFDKNFHQNVHIVNEATLNYTNWIIPFLSHYFESVSTKTLLAAKIWNIYSRLL